MRRYMVLVRVPHGLRLVVGTAMFYPGQAGLGLVLLLALHHATGSFATAGAALAAETAGFSLSGLAQGRVIDRLGTVVIIPMTPFCLAAIAAMIVALSAGAPAALLVVLAAVLGSSIPAAGPALRAVWSSLLDDPSERSTAFAYMSLVQDAGFVAGPAVLGAVAVTVSSEVALVCCWSLMACGALTAATFAAQPSFTGSSRGLPRSLLRPIASVACVMAVVGVALDAIDISTTAFATEHHHAQLAGVLLACFSIGSIIGALIYGARTWQSTLHNRLLGCSLTFGLLALGPVAAPSIAVGAPAFVLTGLPLGTTMTTAFLLVAEYAPTDRETEAYAIVSLTLNGGAAFGGVLAGQIVAHGSARDGFLLAVASGLLAATLVVLLRVGDRTRRAHETTMT